MLTALCVIQVTENGPSRVEDPVEQQTGKKQRCEARGRAELAGLQQCQTADVVYRIRCHEGGSDCERGRAEGTRRILRLAPFHRSCHGDSEVGDGSFP